MSDHGFTQSQISFIKQLMTNRNKEVRHEVSDHLDNTLPLKKLVQGTSGQGLVTGSSGPEWSTPASASTYIGTYNYIPVASTTIGSVTITPRNTRPIMVTFSGCVHNYGSGLTLAYTFKLSKSGVDQTTAITGIVRNNEDDIFAHLFMYQPTAADVDVALTFDLKGTCGAHPAVGTVDCRLNAFEV